MQHRNNFTFSALLVACGVFFANTSAASQPAHHNVPLTATQMAEQRLDYPLFRDTFLETRERIDQQIKQGVIVPLPKDAGGGYTHEQHKRNYKTIYEAATLYNLTGKSFYADHVRDLLIAYADMYPTLRAHPEKKEQSPGRLFWQNLNESVFLVYTIQGYEKIRAALSKDQRAHIEKNLLRKLATFLSEESPETFNKVHNHGTWATAGVGITGYVLGDNDLVEKALTGLDKSGKAGFLKQLDKLFSPDGYYSEGPYYQRYALLPFVVFAENIEKYDPQRRIFEYRDGILRKAIDTTIHLSYNGHFFPINDALKEKGLTTPELEFGLAAAYSLTQNPIYLSVSELQGRVILTSGGMKIAQAIHNGKSKPFPFKSVQFRDGPDGTQGALAILRAGDASLHQAVIVKNTSQGMGHGHFDKLGLLVYDNGREVMSDYGAARFLNVVDKNGGHYLRENKSWAKQTIAHNTLVVDEASHFGGKLKKAEKHHPDILLFEETDNVTLTRAKMQHAYADTDFERVVAQLSTKSLDRPLVVDILYTNSKKPHLYDLPVHYHGHITKVSFPYTAHTRKQTSLGTKNGYQHLWHVANAALRTPFNQITWLNADRFYTYSFLAPQGTEVAFTRLGADDPDFNLRHESAFVLRQKKKTNTAFVSVLEPHGTYNPSDEYTLESQSRIEDIQYDYQDKTDIVKITLAKGDTLLLLVRRDKTDHTTKHAITYGTHKIKWKGPFTFIELEKDEDSK